MLRSDKMSTCFWGWFGYTFIGSVRWRASKCCRLLRAAVVLILRFFLVWGSRRATLPPCLISGKFVLVGGRFVDENHEFCSMGRVEEVRQSRPQWVTTISETMPRLFRSNKVGWGAKDLLLLETFFGGGFGGGGGGGGGGGVSIERLCVYDLDFKWAKYCNG